ncbi:tetratricopeptide repeat protein [Mariniphaga sp.]|uniref:tetratricopeptide repeat protein n=1 Tax=Mariniphaga sp. TaxID=1954475 RepID=UPI003567D550
MKKPIILLSLLFFIILSGCSPRTKVTSSQNLKEAGKLDEALTTIEEAANPNQEKAEKTLLWPRTWEVRGEIYQAFYHSEKLSIKKLVENPLDEALKSYQRALELDEKGRFTNSIKVKLTLLSNDFTNQAVEAFNNEKFDLALNSFEQILAINDIPIFKDDNPNVIDTAIIYNAGLAALKAENFDKAIEYFSEAARHGYNGAKIFPVIAGVYEQKKDTLAALKVLKQGFEKYPADMDVLASMIQTYINLERRAEALEYLNMAIEKDPSNATFFLAMGRLYEETDEDEKALKVYQKAIDIDPELFMAWYNIGVFYYNKGVQQWEVAGKVPANDNETYERELKKANDWWEKSLPFMEKCHELDSEEETTIESLKNLYYRLKKMDKYEAMLEEQHN